MTDTPPLFPFLPAQAISFFPFSEGCILFREGSRKIWTLNHTAAVIWCLLESCTDEEDLSLQVARTFNISIEQARRDSLATVASLREDGLLVIPLPGEMDGSTTEISDISSPEVSLSGWSVPQWGRRHFLYTPNHTIEFCSTDEGVAHEYLTAMQHFKVLAAAHGCDTQLCVVQPDALKASLDVYRNGHLHSENVSHDDALVTLLYLTFSCAAEALSDKILFHAAVLEKDNLAFIFPGDAGSGKSTLAALFSKRGYHFISDELAAIDPGSGMLTPLPLPMSIKKGAWAILSPLYPELNSQKTYARADGKEVKILVPELECKFDRDQSFTPAALIFPKYDSDSPAQIREISKSEAMRRLVATCSSSRPLVDEDISAMIRIVDDHPCYSALYPNCDVVYELLEGITRTGAIRS
ncbi:MAG: PqqD family peptide modification chaperone [Desulfobulbaceae bacterium]|nr:PqqD family peptide modification chaperone [Desulfobulbaceae bacterium]